MLLQTISPAIVRVIDKPTREMTVGDVLLQVVGLTGAFVLIALLAGLLVGAIFIGLRILRPHNPFNGDISDQSRLDLGPYSR